MPKCKIKKGFFVLRESDEMCPPGASFSMESYYCDQCPYRNLDGEEEEGEELEYEDSYWEGGDARGAALWYYATRDDMQEATGFEPFNEADYSAVEATGEISFEDEADDDGFLDS